MELLVFLCGPCVLATALIVAMTVALRPSGGGRARRSPAWLMIPMIGAGAGGMLGLVVGIVSAAGDSGLTSGGLGGFSGLGALWFPPVGAVIGFAIGAAIVGFLGDDRGSWPDAEDEE